jgi:DNA polymerase-3 subunit epsilon
MSHDLNEKSVQCVSNFVRALEATGDYRILKRLKAHDEFIQLPADQPTKTAIVLDVETTGLDPRSDQVIELAMVKFAYTTDGRVVSVLDKFSAFNEPTVPIPKEITELTGISDDMVTGHRIDPIEVSSFVSGVDLVIAHNAKFDRPLTELKWPDFQHVPWACSLTQIDWRGLGFDGVRLTHLLAHIGQFHEAHRALDDCRALFEVLAFELPSVGTTVLSLLLNEARRKTARIWAEGAPYELKEKLKRRKYKWNDGSDGRPKSWFVDVDETQQRDEVEFLRKEIYCRDVDPNIQIMDALLRFSNRI